MVLLHRKCLGLRQNNAKGFNQVGDTYPLLKTHNFHKIEAHMNENSQGVKRPYLGHKIILGVTPYCKLLEQS